MKLRRLLTTLFICSCAFSCSSGIKELKPTEAEHYYKLDISPYDGYLIVFDEQITRVRTGRTTMNNFYYFCYVKNNLVYAHELHKPEFLFGEFKNQKTFEVVCEKDCPTIINGIYTLTDMAYTGGW